MKIYRVIPDSFATNEKLDSQKLTGIEDIYYRMGYTSFLGKRGFHRFNTIANSIKEEGKYFYLFAEDAIGQGNNLIGGFHRLRMDTCLVVEYDIPEDIILKNIGYGDYTEDIRTLYLLESYIGKSDLGVKNITTQELDKEKKIDVLVQSLNDCLKRIQEYSFTALDEMDFYVEYLGTYNFDSVIDDYERIKQIILDSSFYWAFLEENGQLIKSPYITGKIVPVNMTFMSHKLQGFDKIAEYYKKMGIKCDFSKEQQEFKKELLHYVNSEEKDNEKIKSLLREKRYI